MKVDDLFQLEEITQTVASPDGQRLAVVILRSEASTLLHRQVPSLPVAGGERADVWLIRRSGGDAVNLTNGARDGSGYWSPVWSPDGQRLALLSTKGDDDVRPYVYELPTGALRRLTDRGVDLRAMGHDGWPSFAMVWDGNATVICALRAPGSPPSYYGMSLQRSYATAPREWAKASAGLSPSVSVLHSGREVSPAERLQGELVSINVLSGHTQLLAEGNVRRVQLGPGRRYLAVLVEIGRRPPTGDQQISPETVDVNLPRTRLGIVDLRQEKVAVKWVGGVQDPRPDWENVARAWAPDGRTLAVIGRAAESDRSPQTLYIVDPATGGARRVMAPELAVRGVVWTRRGELVALARPGSSGQSGQSNRFDWWSLENGRKAPHNLTSTLKEVPASLIPTPAPQELVGVANGQLWSLSLQTGAARALLDTAHSRLQEVIWPPPLAPSEIAVTTLLARTGDRQLVSVRFNASGAYATPLPRPSKTAEIVVYRPKQNLIVFTADEADGTHLWTTDESGSQAALRLSLNGELAKIADPERRSFTYRSADGDSLRAVVLLPVGYRPGRRYPLVTQMYLGQTVDDPAYEPLLSKQLQASSNLHLLAAHGYAVLVPSMPVDRSGSAMDPYIAVAKGVIPAVDKAIDLGIADPDRLAVMGTSFGGYSTYALLTQTARFRAAVAIAAPSNLISNYGTFFAPLRYDAFAHERLFGVLWSEGGQGSMGAGPADNLWRYLRNSPLFYADRVETPLMIVHGDIDYVSMQQGEEFFTALYRRGKPADFVRYWGEGHGISSPANVRDMWQRIFAWFDRHLRPP